jgi:hypothetical protein
MSENIELPEGITYNNNDSNEFVVDKVEETINSTKCSVCDLVLEVVLITVGSRHSGLIKAASGNIVWENSLPKDRVRSIKILNENFASKLDKHKERHSND